MSRKSACKGRSSLGSISRFVTARQLDLFYDRDTYLEWSGQWFFAILNDPSIDTRTAFERLFEATAEEFTRGDHPLGCMISLAGTHCPPGLSNIRDMMAEHRAFSEGAMANRMRKGVANGNMPKDTDCDMLAAYYSAVARGLAVQARDGAAREKLSEIWPCEPGRRKSDDHGSAAIAADLSP